MAGVRRVINAPSGSTVSVLPPAVRQSRDPMATPIRITTNPTAPEYRLVNPDATHPWRQKELITEINAAVGPDDRINQFDVQCLRHRYNVDDDPRYFHKARFGAPQYSPEFRDWIVEQYNGDHDFFRKTREAYKSRAGLS